MRQIECCMSEHTHELLEADLPGCVRSATLTGAAAESSPRNKRSRNKAGGLSRVWTSIASYEDSPGF